MLHHNRETYLAYSLDFKPEEITLRDSFAEWLPSNIIDCHAHSNLPEHVLGMDEKTYWHMLSTFPSFTIEESEATRKLFFPDKKVRVLRFAKTFRGVDHRRANQYLLEKSGLDDRVALFGLPEDVSYTSKMLHQPRLSALKIF